MNTRRDGDTHEQVALEFLLERGYRLVKRQFHYGRAGEIDLVMRDGEVYVMVEVKGRRDHSMGLPEEAVTASKRNRIRQVARGFFYCFGIESYEARFDVVAVDYATGSDGVPEIRHYRDAFR